VGLIEAKEFSSMHVTIITAFPEMFGDFLSTSILGRAVKTGLVRVDLLNLRDFGRGGYRQIDDYAFGAGGMVLAAPQLKDALDAASLRGGGKPFVVYPSPQGGLLTQETVETPARQDHVVILCGHYEGIDERFVQREVDLEVTIGDCVLTGGEIPAMAIVDAMSRLVPGVVGSGEAVEEDSFYRGMLDTPHYTRPALWEGMAVPDVLLSGDQAGILAWRRRQAVERTLSRRPDLLARAAIRDYLSGGVYLAYASDGGPTEDSSFALVSLCRVYGLERPLFLIRVPARRAVFRAPEALDPTPKIFGSALRLREWIQGREKGRLPLVVRASPFAQSGAVHDLNVKSYCLKRGGPVLFLFDDVDQEKGESEDKLREVWGDEVIVAALSLTRGEESLPLPIRAAIALDRFLGKR
jgi:tRNA (guanine37-N1)-methyltransferase